MAKKKVVWIVIGVFAGAMAGLAYLAGPEALAAYRSGILSETKQTEYHGTSIENLRRLHTAMMLYHDSEGQFPAASGWMDAIANRLQTADLKPGEGEQKLRNPALGSTDPNVYGYAMNEAASAQFKDDVEGGKDAVLLFDSQETERNASGDPLKDAPNPPRSGGNLAITVGGTLLIDGKPAPAPTETRPE